MSASQKETMQRNAGAEARQSTRAITNSVESKRPANFRPTAKNVARAAGVSPMTVSNVVNGRFGEVGGETRKAVEDVIWRLGYRPQSTGRHLRLAHQFSIGMLIVDNSPAFLADPFITQIVAGLSNYLSKRDYALVVQGTVPEHLSSSSLFRRQRTDAFCIILSGARSRRQAMIKKVLNLRHPVILFQEKSERDDLLQVMRQDDFGGARELARLVVEKGAEGAIWFLVPSIEWPAISERRRGIKAAIRKAPSKIDLQVVTCGDGSFRSTAEALSRHLVGKKRPRAIMGGNDQMGIAALSPEQAHPNTLRCSGDRLQRLRSLGVHNANSHLSRFASL